MQTPSYGHLCTYIAQAPTALLWVGVAAALLTVSCQMARWYSTVCRSQLGVRNVAVEMEDFAAQRRDQNVK